MRASISPKDYYIEARDVPVAMLCDFTHTRLGEVPQSLVRHDGWIAVHRSCHFVSWGPSWETLWSAGHCYFPWSGIVSDQNWMVIRPQVEQLFVWVTANGSILGAIAQQPPDEELRFHVVSPLRSSENAVPGINDLMQYFIERDVAHYGSRSLMTFPFSWQPSWLHSEYLAGMRQGTHNTAAYYRE